MSRVLLVVALAVVFTTELPAQRLGAPAPRPRLEAGADTNDANAYYQYGLQTFDRDAASASAAFYWAARLNPGWGEPLYARRAAYAKWGAEGGYRIGAVLDPSLQQAISAFSEAGKLAGVGRH